jgi:hypothetical protein
MSVAPDLRTRIFAGDKRVVAGNAAIEVQAHQLALQLVQLLRIDPVAEALAPG